MIYKVAYEDDMRQSHGSEYFSNRTAARAAKKKTHLVAFIGLIPTPKTKKEILLLLNRIARHPDNG
jgi:hypothetical protein